MKMDAQSFRGEAMKYSVDSNEHVEPFGHEILCVLMGPERTFGIATHARQCTHKIPSGLGMSRRAERILFVQLAPKLCRNESE